MQTNKPNLIVELTFEFSLKVIEYCELLESKKKYNLANQLFRSGTSIEANIREAQNSESNADFIHKLKKAAKETDETEYWLLLCKESKNYPDTSELLAKVESIHKIISKIISTIKNKKSLSNQLIIKSHLYEI